MFPEHKVYEVRSNIPVGVHKMLCASEDDAMRQYKSIYPHAKVLSVWECAEDEGA